MALTADQIEKLKEKYVSGLELHFSRWDETLSDADRAVAIGILEKCVGYGHSVHVRQFLSDTLAMTTWVDHLLILVGAGVIVLENPSEQFEAGFPTVPTNFSHNRYEYGDYRVRFTPLGKMYLDDKKAEWDREWSQP